MKQDKQLKKLKDKLWPERSFPLALADGLNTFTKPHLAELCKEFEIRNISKLNKEALVEKMAEVLPERIQETALFWDMNRLKLIQKVANSNGFSKDIDVPFENLMYFRALGVIYPSTVDGASVLLMPTELVEWWKSSGLTSNHEIIQRNTTWIQLARGLIYHYGVLTMDQLLEMISKYTTEHIDPSDFSTVILEAVLCYDDLEYDNKENIYYFCVDDLEHIRKEQEFRSQVDFYPFTKQQVLKAANSEYADRNAVYMTLVRYILAHYDIDREEADLMVMEWVDKIRNGLSLNDMIEHIQESIEFTSEETLGNVIDLLVPLMNGTKQWVLKGYSPSELSSRNRSTQVGPLAQASNAPVATAPRGEIISFETKKKIGRNDLCPCGSGSKYKKCCGK